MSRERELLKKLIASNDDLDIGDKLYEEILAELAKPETNQLIVKDVIKQKWKEGFNHGTKNIQNMYQEIEKTKNSYMDENEKLTNYILELENKIEELAKPEQEPVAWMNIDKSGNRRCTMIQLKQDIMEEYEIMQLPLYTSSPPQYKPLSDDEIFEEWKIDGICNHLSDKSILKISRAIEKRITEVK